MKASDIEVLKTMSDEVVHAIPSGMLVDGAGRLYRGSMSEPISLQEVLARIEDADRKAKDLNAVIQSIQPRKGKT